MNSDEIKRRAFIHYQFRQRNNIPGDADGDWFIAEATLEWEKLQQQKREFHYPEGNYDTSTNT